MPVQPHPGAGAVASTPAEALQAPDEKRRYVRAMFSSIAPRYDLLNRVLSLNVDRSWRRRAVARLGWEQSPTGRYLDACAGTLDLAATLIATPGFGGTVVASDFAVPMLRGGAGKAPGGRVAPVGADTLMLPIADEAFDGAMVGFGIRNLSDLDAGLRELWRVLRQGARLVILDFATPPSAPLRALYLFYFRQILPRVGRLVSGHPTAYSYLPESVRDFPAPAQLEGRLQRAGFLSTGHGLLTGGIAAVVWGER